MLMMLGAPLFALAIQARIAMVITQTQQPVNGLLHCFLRRFGAAAEGQVIHSHQLSYRST